MRDAWLFLVMELTAVLVMPLRRSAGHQPYYDVIDDFTGRVNELVAPRVVELGSRNVTGVRHRTRFESHVEIVGVDVHSGEDVDLQGDVHQLGDLLPGEAFDAAFGISVFEHLAMPWKVVLEINRVLKPGGLLLLATHPAWPPHELPWDFWRFSAAAFPVLLNEATGFELLRCEEGEPGRMLSLTTSLPARTLHRTNCSFAVAAMARKVGSPTDRIRWDVPLSEIVATSYRRNPTTS